MTRRPSSSLNSSFAMRGVPEVSEGLLALPSLVNLLSGGSTAQKINVMAEKRQVRIQRWVSLGITILLHVTIYVHTLVKNTDNIYAIFQHLISDQMMHMMVNPYRRT